MYFCSLVKFEFFIQPLTNINPLFRNGQSDLSVLFCEISLLSDNNYFDLYCSQLLFELIMEGITLCSFKSIISANLIYYKIKYTSYIPHT